MTYQPIAAIAVAAVLASAPAAAANTAALTLHGQGIMADLTLTYAPNPNTGVLPLTSPNPVDPIGSYVVTGISGTFSDANIGLSNVAITGIVPADPGNPEPDNLYAPHSFGHYVITNGVPDPNGGVAPGFSYDNLFYPGGSPRAASDYPFHGGLLDIYGLVFSLADGNAVNFWSNGYLGGALTYGIGVTDGTSVLDYQNGVAVPEPASWALLIAGFGLTGAALRRRLVPSVPSA
jgi:hypothetical protein